jgi:hypothetical protein
VRGLDLDHASTPLRQQRQPGQQSGTAITVHRDLAISVLGLVVGRFLSQGVLSPEGLQGPPGHLVDLTDRIDPAQL